MLAGNGNVGIGTTNPQNTLQVIGTTNLRGTTYIGQNTNGTAEIDAYNGDAYFGDNSTGANSGISVNPAGYVGIGTTAPSSLLTINNGGVEITAPGGDYSEGIRIHPSPTNGWSDIQLGAVSGGSGTGVGQWGIFDQPDGLLTIGYDGNNNTYTFGQSGFFGVGTNGNQQGEIQAGPETGSGTFNVGVYSNSANEDFAGGHGEYTSGGTWVNASARYLKENFTPVNDQTILNKIIQLPITQWNYKSDTTAKHIGPMAEDFYSIFKLGDNSTSISTIDPASIALVGIKALDEKINTQQQEIDTLQTQNTTLIGEVQKLLSK